MFLGPKMARPPTLAGVAPPAGECPPLFLLPPGPEKEVSVGFAPEGTATNGGAPVLTLPSAGQTVSYQLMDPRGEAPMK